MLVVVLLLGCLAGMNLVSASESDDEDDTDTIQEVHSIYWQAKVTANIKVKDLNTGKKVKIDKNTKVTVTKRAYNTSSEDGRGVVKKSLCEYGDYVFYVKNNYLKYIKDLCTAESEGDYNTISKEYFVNNVKKVSSDTDKLIWVCLDKQRINVFKGSKGHWTLEKCFLTSTGTANTPTRVAIDRVNFKKDPYRLEKSYVRYFTEAIGSGFHKWDLKGSFKKRIGKHTISHGCIRMKLKDAIWMYNNDNIPILTRVVIY